MNSNSQISNGQAASPSSQAALVLVFGTTGTANKHYSLDRDALLIGKGRGCDLVLEAPDISNIHCVVTRNSGGFAVRDCDSRSGTKLNGDRVKDATLHDGDLMQLGPFSFKVILPPQRSGSFRRDVPARLIRLERKRQNLARLALSLRQRARQPKKLAPEKAPAADVETSQLLAQAEQLQQRLRDCELRTDQLDKAERALTSDRAALRREMEEFRQQSDQEEQEFQQRQQQLDHQTRERQDELEGAFAQRKEQLEREWVELEELAQAERRQWQQQGRSPDDLDEQQQRQADVEQQFQQRQQELEQQFQQRQADLEQELARREVELEQSLDQRRQELELDFSQRQRQLQHDFEQWRESLAQQLSQQEKPVPKDELPELDEEEDMEKTVMLPMVNGLLTRTNQLSADEQTVDLLNRQQAAEQTVELLNRQQAALERSEAVLKQQQTAFAEMLAELKELKQFRGRDVPHADPDLEHLLRENSELRRQIEEQPQAETVGTDPALLRELGQLRDNNDLLQKLLDEKNNELQQARQENPNSVQDMPAVEDVDSYEAELVQFRRQLEVEREQLHRQAEALRIKNEELDDATRELEMEMSRERAELARERMRMDRLREEIQSDMERLHRNGDVMERLAPVKKLREEIVESRQKPAATTPPPVRTDLNTRRVTR